MKNFWGLRSLLLPAAFFCMVVSGCDLLGSDDDDEFAERPEGYVKSSSSDDDDNSSSSKDKSSSSTKSNSSSSQEGRSSSSNGATYDKIKNTMTDLRTGRTYKTVKLDGKIWMAENIYIGSLCYDDDEANCEKYGSMSSWCPDGWYEPSKEDWESMFESIGGADSAGYYLKSKTGWEDNSNGVDKYGFNVLPGGYRGHRGYGDYYEDTYIQLGKGTKFETSSRTSGFAPYRVVFDQGPGVSFAIVSQYDEVYTRCIKEYEEGDVEIEYGTMTDPRDGRTYRTEPIGDYTIMAEGLRYTGSDPSYPDTIVWVNCNKDSTRCRYRFGTAMLGSFNGHLVQGVCPSGWHIPSMYELNRMDEILNTMFSSSYEKEHYIYPDTGFYGFFSSTVEMYGYRGELDTLWRGYDYPVSVLATVVRCVKDDPAQSDGEVVDSRDGSVYRTVKIGDTEWMAENLKRKVDSSYCVFQDSTEFFEDGDSCATYGRYYCQYDSDNLCMEGWHIPDSADIKILQETYPSAYDWTSTQHWIFDYSGLPNDVNYSGTNASGLNLLPTGYLEKGDSARYLKYGKRAVLRTVFGTYEMWHSSYTLSEDIRFLTVRETCLPIRCVRDR